MTPEQQRIEIVKAHYKLSDYEIRRETRKGKPDPNGVVILYKSCEGGGAYCWERVPDYPRDLNAMHKAEKVLTAEQRDVYLQWLYRIGDREHRMATIYWLSVSATAAQRAEAFLKTIGKWVES